MAGCRAKATESFMIRVWAIYNQVGHTEATSLCRLVLGTVRVMRDEAGVKGRAFMRFKGM